MLVAELDALGLLVLDDVVASEGAVFGGNDDQVGIWRGRSSPLNKGEELIDSTLLSSNSRYFKSGKSYFRLFVLFVLFACSRVASR